MHHSIFSIASFLVYLFGIFASLNTVEAIFSNAVQYLFTKFHFLHLVITNEIYICYALVFIFTIIGFRFYWHAAHIDHNESFFSTLNKLKKNIYFDKLLRIFWISACLSFPVFISNKFFNNHYKTILVLFLIFSFMYASVLLWFIIYRKALESAAMGFTASVQILICVCDAVSIAIFFILPAVTYVFVEMGSDQEYMSIVFIFAVVVASLITCFQLIIFSFARLAKFTKTT